MPVISQAQAQAQLDAWLQANLAVATGQSYEIAGRKLERADAREIRMQIDYWRGQVALAANASIGRSRTRTIVAGR